MFVAEELCYLTELTDKKCSAFQHALVTETLEVTDTTDPQVILLYTPPENTTWIVTQVSLRSIPPVDDAGLTAGDWRSEDFDATGTTRAYIRVNGNKITSDRASYFALFNRPVLFCFEGNKKVEIVIERGMGSVAATQRIVVVAHGYFVESDLYSKLSPNVTQIIARFDGTGG